MATRRVTVAVDPLHAPADLQPGDLVDVWSTPRDPVGVSSLPAPVLSGVAVASVSPDGMGLGGEIGVALDVPVGDVPATVAALRSGVLDLIAVPVSSQQAGA